MSTARQELPRRIEAMTGDDLAEVLVIEGEAYDYPWPRAVFQDCLRVGYGCWVVKGEGAVEAYGITAAAAGEAHILNLCVRPSRQRNGLGAMLLEHLCRVARDGRVARLFLEVRPSNTAAIGLYTRAGFARIGIRRAYYPGPRGREDALVFSLATNGGQT